MPDIDAGQLYRWALAHRTPNEWAIGGTPTFPVGNLIGRTERFIVGTTGRQVGKTDEISDALDRAMRAESAPHDNKPENPPDVGYLAPTYAKAMIGIDRYMEMLTRVYGKDSFRVNQNDHELTIKDPAAGRVGAKLTWLSAEEMLNVIGNTFTALFVDEAQMVPDRIWDKILPTLDVRDARCVVFGTPDTEIDQTWFQGLWQAGQDPLDANVHSFSIASWEAPWMNIDRIIATKKTMGDREFRRLYGGEWVEDAGLVFSNVDQATLSFEPAFEYGRTYFMAVDLAIHEDFNVVMIGDPITKTAIHVERWNNTDPVATYDRIEALWERFGKPRMWVDATGMGAITVRELTKFAKVTPVVFNGVAGDEFNKMNMVRQLASDLQHRNTMFPASWEDLKREFKNFVYLRTPAGKLTAGARSGAHDDLVMTYVLLNHAFRTRGKHADGDREQRNYLTGVGMAPIPGMETRLINA